MRALQDNQQISLRRPEAFRPWQHVLQCLSGYLTITAGLEACRQSVVDHPLSNLDSSEICSAWNIGPQPGSELKVRELVELFVQNWGSGGWIDASEQSSMREAMMLRLSIDRAISLLGWKPVWDVEETVKRTVQWIREFEKSPESIQEFTLEQIQQFQTCFEAEIRRS